MDGERFLVTGVLGCIGAWVSRELLASGASVVGFDLGQSRHRLELVLEPGDRDRVDLVAGDITDLGALERALAEHAITNVIHLAAVQVPDARANPPLGAAVNVLGTTNVLEAVKRHRDRIGSVVYTSSAAVYGPHDAGEEAERTQPGTHYGVTKVANEGAARVYWQDEGIPSFGVRPYVVYGPGRDHGMTATPTAAMLAAARGEPYRIPFGGWVHMQHARDVAATLIRASRAKVEGANVCNLGPDPVHMSEVVDAILAAAPGAEIRFDDVPLPFPERLEHGAVDRLLGTVPTTPLAEGVRETIERFRIGGA
jgi:nucleoside-diphosphate-sugar epimerase